MPLRRGPWSVPHVLGATYTPDCARIQPCGWPADWRPLWNVGAGGSWSRRRRRSVGPRRVVTDRGEVRASVTVRAAEAWSSAHAAPGGRPLARRAVVPVYSLIVATRPLPAGFWAEAGLAGGQTFTDHRHLIVYGQRTADDRLVFGGRGAPYHWRSRIDSGFDRDERVFAGLRAAARELFPRLSASDFTHAWGGPLGIPRDWHASVGLSADGAGWAGGYVGDGVGTSNLAGRTLAALILGRDEEIVQLPWVNHRSRRWEPEPLRWLLVNAGLRLMTVADAEERVTCRPSLIAAALSRPLGH